MAPLLLIPDRAVNDIVSITLYPVADVAASILAPWPGPKRTLAGQGRMVRLVDACRHDRVRCDPADHHAEGRRGALEINFGHFPALNLDWATRVQELVPDPQDG